MKGIIEHWTIKERRQPIYSFITFIQLRVIIKLASRQNKLSSITALLGRANPAFFPVRI
jgi:hypothetical protein